MQAEEHGAPRHVTANGPAHGRDMTMGPDWGAMAGASRKLYLFDDSYLYACSLVFLNVTTRYFEPGALPRLARHHYGHLE
jgi:hypothetical protein